MWGGSDETESIRTIQHAVVLGINLIDTEPVYGFGHSEELVGKALAEGGCRDKAVLATKVGLEWVDGKVYRNSTPARIRQEIEDSLLRLRTDRIDLYQVHWPDPLVPIEDTAKTLLELRREGKILAIGVSNYSPEQMDTWRKIAPLHNAQPPYNIFEREIEADVLPYALEHKLLVLSYGAICRGLLSEKMQHNRKFWWRRFATYRSKVSASPVFPVLESCGQNRSARSGESREEPSSNSPSVGFLTVEKL